MERSGLLGAVVAWIWTKLVNAVLFVGCFIMMLLEPAVRRFGDRLERAARRAAIGSACYLVLLGALNLYVHNLPKVAPVAPATPAAEATPATMQSVHTAPNTTEYGEVTVFTNPKQFKQ